MDISFQTKNIDQASAITAVTKIYPTITFDDDGLATFSFPGSPEVAAVVAHYDCCLMVHAITLLTARNQLISQAYGGSL